MQKLVIVIAAAAVAVAGCSSSKKTTATSTTPTSASASPTPTVLAKADFVTQANAACDKYSKQQAALPTPANATDYANMVTSLEGLLDIGAHFYPELTALVDQSADKATLHEKWLDASQAGYEAGKVEVQKALDAAKAKDSATVLAAFGAIEKLPDHTKEFATYLNTYGLTKCAAFETG